MAFLAVSTSNGEGGGDRLPVLKYDARAGRLFLMDRTQTADGWQSTNTDITMSQPVFAVDFGSLEVGWAHFPKGAAPMFFMAPLGTPIPVRPPSPGADQNGKAQHFKSAFRVKVGGKAIGGVREFAANAAVVIQGMNELHTLFEQASEAHAGKIPTVKIVNTLPVQSGQSTNYQPVFEITGWVDRPASLGPRTVAPPALNGHAHAPPAAPAPKPSNHVPPPAPKPAPAPVAAMPAFDDEVPF